MKKYILIPFLFLIVSFSKVKAADFSGVKALVERRVPWLKEKIIFTDFKAVPGSRDAFTLQTVKNHLIISATSSSAASMGVNWYLKYYCNQSLSFQTSNIRPLKKLPLVEGIVTQITPFKYRYSLNYCTLNYTMAFYKWPQWSYVLDWLALNGVNIALASAGVEKVWDLTLQDFNFNKKERVDFIAGPGFTAWWLMGNLEGWGGPVSDQMIDQQAALQKRILARMKELDIQPVMQGFYGMVPTTLQAKYPQANIINQGQWAGGFVRPAMLSPEDPLFAKMAGSFYRHMQELYGKDFHFFSGDPFHEGGISKGVNLAEAGSNIYTFMDQYFPGTKWVLQAWGGNPKEEIISKIPKRKLLILDLMGEDHQNYIAKNGYNGRDWIFGSVNNFGENNGFTGKLRYLAREPFRVLSLPAGKSLAGIGEIPEGYNNNPVLYDMIYDVAWQEQPVDLKNWIQKYTAFRYGKRDSGIEASWQVFLNTIYTSDISPQQGAPESIFCARPSLKAEHARTWGTLKLRYDTEAFEKAVIQFAAAAAHFRGVESYRYDLIDLTRQVISNQALEVYHKMIGEYNANDKDGFQKTSSRFLSLLKSQDTMLQTDKNFRLNTWLQSAFDFAQTPADKNLAVWNAKTQISYWGPDNPATDLHDYANKEWGGLMGTLYLQRWQSFIHYLEEKLDGKDPLKPDFFKMEKEWADAPYKFSAPSKKDAVLTALKTLQEWSVDERE